MAKPPFATKDDLAAMAAQDDAWLDAFDASNTPPLPDNWEEHPFWADKDALANPETAAGKAVLEMQQECTPQERAEACKEMGNDNLKQGTKISKKLLIRGAVDKYTEGLNILEQAGFPPEASSLRCALYSNRAHANGLLGNWRNALNDALWAVNVDASHIKSHIRAANAARQLRMWPEALSYCARGLEVEPGAPELLKIQKTCTELAAEQEARAAREAAAREAKLAPVRDLARTLCARGFRMTRPQLDGFRNEGEKVPLPWLDEQQALHFPVMLFYPEARPYHDTIEDFAEDEVFRDHLDRVFAAEAGPLPWDDKGEYTRERVELYYCSHAGKVLTEAQVVDALQGKYPEKFEDDGPQRYGRKTASMKLVGEDLTLADVLRREDHVMPGVPVFWVISRGSTFAHRFLEQCNS